MAMAEDKKKSEISSIIEKLTTSGSTDLDVTCLKRLKSICKKSNDNVSEAFAEVFSQLQKEHSEIRLSSIILINELFVRSHYFRELLIDRMDQFLNLTLKTKNPLPPPTKAAKLLVKKTHNFLKAWNKKFGQTYLKLSLGYKFVFENDPQFAHQPFQTQRQIQKNALKLENIKQQELKKKRLHELLENIKFNLSDIMNCTQEVESCFALLVPKFDVAKEENLESEPSTSNNSRELGIINQGYSINLDLNTKNITKVTLEVNDDNKVVIENLKDREKVLKRRHIPQVKRWISEVKSLDKNNEFIVELKSVLHSINACLDKANDLHIVSNYDSSDSDFEEVEEKEYLTLLPDSCLPKVRQNLKSDDSVKSKTEGKSKKLLKKEESDFNSTSKGDTNVWTPMRKDDNLEDPASYSLAIKNMKRFLTDENKSKKEVPLKIFKTIKVENNLHPQAPILPYGHDLLEWDKEKKLELSKSISLGVAKEMDIGHRFWSSNDAETGLSEAAMSSLTSRTFNFTGNFEPVKWSCRAPLPSGKLCPRMDRVKCPFHGKIIPRNVKGEPTNEEDAKRIKVLENKKLENEVPEWQDPDLLAEIKAKTGIDLKMPDKKRRGKKKKEKKYENLTDIGKKSTSRTRLQQKVLSKKAMDRVSYVMDKQDAKKSFDKFGNNFNYALTK